MDASKLTMVTMNGGPAGEVTVGVPEGSSVSEVCSLLGLLLAKKRTRRAIAAALEDAGGVLSYSAEGWPPVLLADAAGRGLLESGGG